MAWKKKTKKKMLQTEQNMQTNIYISLILGR